MHGEYEVIIIGDAFQYVLTDNQPARHSSSKHLVVQLSGTERVCHAINIRRHVILFEDGPRNLICINYHRPDFPITSVTVPSWPIEGDMVLVKGEKNHFRLHHSLTVFTASEFSKWLLYKNCSALIGSSFQSSQNPRSILRSYTCQLRWLEKYICTLVLNCFNRSNDGMRLWGSRTPNARRIEFDNWTVDNLTQSNFR